MTFPTIFSPDTDGEDGKGIYRYVLSRDLASADELTELMEPKLTRGIVNFIGVNPSKATAEVSDPTCTRERKFSELWGFRHYVKTNLFAYRSTDPEKMKVFGEPIGPDNDHWLDAVAAQAEMIVCAWGNHGTHLGRGDIVTIKLLRKHSKKLYCLGFTEDGEPKHTLARGKAFIPYDFQPLRLI